MEERRFPKIETYYSTLSAMQNRFDNEERPDRLQSETMEDYLVWKSNTRKLLADLIGLPKMQSCDLAPETLEIAKLPNGITREKVIIRVEPDIYMPMYILIPPTIRKGEVQCFIALPGHQSAGKYSIAGCYDIPAAKGCIEKYHYDYGMQLAKEGFVTFCPDCRGFGERRETAMQKEEETNFVNGSCYQISHMAQPLGMTLVGMNTWDIFRLIDYIKTRTEWNTKRLGCLGFSGGGMQTLWAAALDDRISIPVISGYLYGYKEALLERNGNCNCNYVPHLWEHLDMGDIAALLAPRPVWIQSCREDHLNGTGGLTNVTKQLDIMRRAYRIFEAEHKIFHEICPGGHMWHEENLKEYLCKLGI